MANTLNVNLADCPADFPLRGDMDGARLDFTPTATTTPTARKFRVKFITKDTKTYTIKSATHPFDGLQSQLQTEFSFGGKKNLYVVFGYDQKQKCFTLLDTNIVSGETAVALPGDGGSNPATPISQLSIVVDSTETVAADQLASVSNVGTDTALRLKFKIPRGPAGTTTVVGGGTGGGFRPEALLVQNEAGEITPDGSISDSFRVLITKNPLKVKAPINFAFGQSFVLHTRQAITGGPYKAEWALAYAHPNRTVPDLATKPGGLNSITCNYTGDLGPDYAETWSTVVAPQNSSIGFGAPAFIAHNVQQNKDYYVLRSATLPAATTEMRPGDTLKILRDGLGVEAYGAIEGGVNGNGNYLISGAQPNGGRAELRTGAGVRAAFNRGVLAFGSGAVVVVQDLIVSGAREQLEPGNSSQSHAAQGVSVTGTSDVTLRNMRIYDNENGILSGNIGNANPADDYTGILRLEDVEFDANGVGDDGLTHNIYMGHNNSPWYATRCTFKNAQRGHNVKSRQGDAILVQCLISNSLTAREIDLPNGGQLHVTHSRIEHFGNATQNDCIRIGAEGIDTSRKREYIIRNTHIRNDKPQANQASFVWNEDPDVDVLVIDCTFESPNAPGGTWSGTDARGMRGRVIVSFTPGVTPGPLLPVGAQPLAVTQLA